MEEEHNNITYIPPPSNNQSATEERISSHVTEDHSFENKIESSYSPEKAAMESSYSPVGREVGVTRIETDKRISIIKAWEDSEKTKAENKAQKEMSSILSWENTKRAAVEAKLRRKEVHLFYSSFNFISKYCGGINKLLEQHAQEELEKKKAEYAEKLKNKLAKIHREAEMKRADIEAQHGKAFVEAEEKATKYEATGAIPNKKTWCCGTST